MSLKPKNDELSQKMEFDRFIQKMNDENVLSGKEKVEFEANDRVREKKLATENYIKNIREQNKIKKKNQERNQIGCLVISVFLIILLLFIW